MRLPLALFLVALGCGGARPLVRPDGAGPGTVSWVEGEAPLELPSEPPSITPGERMTYRLSVFDIEVGAYVIAVDAPADLDGRPAIAVQSGVQSTGIAAAVKQVRVDLAVWLDPKTGRPLRFRAEEVAGGSDDTIETTEADFAAVADGAFPVRTSRPDTGAQAESQIVRGTPVDITAALIMLRGWEGSVGERRTLDVLRSRYLWRTQFTRAGREAVASALGELPAVRFEAVSRRLRRDGSPDDKSPERRFSIWISDDGDRAPLLLVASSDYGDLRMEIVDYARP